MADQSDEDQPDQGVVVCRRVATSCWWSLLSRVVRHVAVSARGRPLSPQENDARGALLSLYFVAYSFFLHPLRGNGVCALQQRPRDLRPLSLALQSAATAFSVSIALSSSSRRELPFSLRDLVGGFSRKLVQHFSNTPAALLLSLPSAKCIYFKVLSSRFIFFFFIFLRSPDRRSRRGDARGGGRQPT